MSSLAPQRLAGMVMGTWFLALAVGNYLAGRAAALSAARGWGFLFVTLILASLLIAAALFLVAPMIRRLLQGDAPVELPKAKVNVKAEDTATHAGGAL
jgi:POT family proton-dependent oligopeptide transporter